MSASSLHRESTDSLILVSINLSYHDTHIIIDGIYTDISRCCAAYGEGSGPIHMNYLACSGTEFKLVYCGYSSGYFNHAYDWSVTCLNGNTTS